MGPTISRQAESVDAYIDAAPKEARGKLREIRAAIRAVAPEASESISYRIPFYDYKGRLVYFGLQKTHIGLYLRPRALDEHRSELGAYETTKSAVHLPLDRRIPVQLIKRLVRTAMEKNEAEESSSHKSRRTPIRAIRKM